jgi:hypothetical protein
MKDEDLPLVQIYAGAMISPRHSVIMRRYLMGQYRIQLTRVDEPDPHAPPGHGTIVRELCTYNRAFAVSTVLVLRGHDDPERWCRSIERPWNCESPGRGRIRLDSLPPDPEPERPK